MFIHNIFAVTKLINEKLQSYRAQVDEIVKDLHELTIHIGNEELANTVSDLRNRIHEPFMFVIVGEVKSGKSSFINALLGTGKEVAQVAPQPMTDTIQQILYGEEEEEVVINPHLKKIHLPVDILKEIAIVDTPGTNTIIEHHQEITESFIPASDLIVFVFEAKNPYRQSAWDFFKYIREDWRKKIIFVLQQKDLMPEEDLRINIQGVEEYAQKKGIADPQVFAVSAKEEMDGQVDKSGFATARQFIAQHITGGQAPFLKLQNNLSTSRNINERILDGLELRREQLRADEAFRKDITETLHNQEQRSYKQVDVLVENLIAGYDRITREKQQELAQGLSTLSLVRRSLASIFSRKASAQEWLENLARDMELRLESELREKLDSGVGDLAESIQQMAQLIDLKIRNSKTILRNDHEIFSDIAERRNNVLQELQNTFAEFMRRSENLADPRLLSENAAFSPPLATGSGIAVIGLLLTSITSGVVFDITGGVLTTIGLLFAGLSTSKKRRKIVQRFREEVDNGRKRIEQEVTEQLKQYISNLRKKIDANFHRFDALMERETQQIDALEHQHQGINERLEKIEAELEALVEEAS